MNIAAPVRSRVSLPRMRGRRSIFRNKTVRIVGMVPVIAKDAFDMARARLARMVRCAVDEVSDGDTLTFLSLGEKKARELFLKDRDS